MMNPTPHALSRLTRARRTLAAAALCLAVAPEAHAAPSRLPDTALSLEVKQADVVQLFRLLAEVGQRDVQLDGCVKGTVDLVLRNTPQAVVWDAVADKLRLTYREEGGVVRVGCRDDPERLAVEAALQKRVTLEVRGVALREVLTVLAGLAGLEGVQDDGIPHTTVTLTLHNVRLKTALAAVADTTGHGIHVSHGHLVVEAADTGAH